jgi:hypothetical protein
MKTSGIFTIHKHRIKLKSMSTPIFLRPFSDVHRSSFNHDEDAWKDWIKESKERLAEYPTLFIGVGDYDDLISSSEKNHFYSRDIHDSTKLTFEEIVKLKTTQLADELSFAKGHIIGLGGGNHYYDLMAGYSTDQLLCSMLDTKFLGVCSLTRLVIEYNKNHKISTDIFMHHGLGGASHGSSVRKMELLQWVRADIYLMGHDHKMFTFPKKSISLTDGGSRMVLKERIHHFVRTGGFLNSYQTNNKFDYNVNVCREPLILGSPEIKLQIKRDHRLDDIRSKKRSDKVYLDIKVTT